MLIKFLTPLQLSIGVKTMVIGGERDEAQLHIKEQWGYLAGEGVEFVDGKLSRGHLKGKGNSC